MLKKTLLFSPTGLNIIRSYVLIALNVAEINYMLKRLSDLVNTALNTCSLSLGIKLISLAAKNINKAEGSPELAEN